ncbi:DUF364 domain-containing protein [Anaerosinus massiliensis]|uniref:DUF364 domain-containing protein n=1 Tax=Massilibacillus massiliensis TaxID=1806837 RepID=UPI000DA5F68D|nr:DUF364 domain-containing protein [Massilibacillus massiliensis]
MWKLYDTLIEGIPEDCMVEDFICGTYSVLVKSGNGYGFSYIVAGDSIPETMKRSLGMPLRKLAACIKSWNFVEASIGMAAINAWYNSPQEAAHNGIALTGSQYSEDRLNDPLIAYQNEVKNKKVAFWGHFPYIEQLFQPVSEVKIIEIDPQEGDYPAFSYEYILPESDFVFINCSSLIYKTLPRMLELAQNAYVILVGPFTPMAPQLFSFGVHDLSGFIVQDGTGAARIVNGMERKKIYAFGRKVAMKSSR